MKHLFTLILLISLCSCKEDKQLIVSPIKNINDTIQAFEPVLRYHPVIKDKSLYSKEFVEYAKKYESTSQIRIIDDHIEVDGKDVDFPSKVEIDKNYLFTAQNENFEYELVVNRYTPADITFEYKFIENGFVTVYKGKAYSGLDFGLGSEVGTDDSTGVGFFYEEYHGITDDGLCAVTIGIGEPDDNNRIRAVFGVSCENETQNINVSTKVTLRQHME